MAEQKFTSDELAGFAVDAAFVADKLDKIAGKMKQSGLPLLWIQFKKRKDALADLKRFAKRLEGIYDVQLDSHKAGEDWTKRHNRRKEKDDDM